MICSELLGVMCKTLDELEISSSFMVFWKILLSEVGCYLFQIPCLSSANEANIYCFMYSQVCFVTPDTINFYFFIVTAKLQKKLYMSDMFYYYYKIY